MKCINQLYYFVKKMHFLLNKKLRVSVRICTYFGDDLHKTVVHLIIASNGPNTHLIRGYYNSNQDIIKFIVICTLKNVHFFFI